MNKQLFTATGLLAILFTFPVHAADYKIDPAHSFIEFRIKHLGISWLHGRFNTLSGNLNYDSASPGR